MARFPWQFLFFLSLTPARSFAVQQEGDTLRCETTAWPALPPVLTELLAEPNVKGRTLSSNEIHEWTGRIVRIWETDVDERAKVRALLPLLQRKIPRVSLTRPAYYSYQVIDAAATALAHLAESSKDSAIKDQALGFFAALTNSPEVEIRRIACESLSRFKHPASRVIFKGLATNDPSDEVRVLAAQKLCILNSKK